MQAAILAGGLGERLRPATEKIPKPLVQVKGKPFLYYLLKMLSRYCIEKTLLLIGYKGELIEEYLKGCRDFHMKYYFSREPELLGTGGALKLAEKKLDDEFILLYGDSYLPIDYNDLADKFKRSGKLSMMAIYDNSINTFVKNNVNLEGSLISAYDKNSQNESFGYVEAGVLVFKKEAVNIIPAGKNVSLEAEMFPELIASREMAHYVSKERFYDIGTHERLKEFEAYIG